MAKLTAREKLAREKSPKRVKMEKAYGGIAAGETMFVATPQMVDHYICQIPHGTSVTIPELRDDLATKNGCDGTCPMSTSIFIRMSAEAALEDLADGIDESEITPFWRVITTSDKITKKLNIDPEWVDHRRGLEGL